MKINKVFIKNFKCIGNNGITLNFSDNIIVLIGENNVGKSSILEALDFFFSGKKNVTEDHFHNKRTDKENGIEIKIIFDNLSEDEKKHQAINSYLYEVENHEFWELKKVYYFDSKNKLKIDYSSNGKLNPSGLTQNCDDLFTEEKMQKVFVKAVQNVEDESGYSAKSSFGQIFNLLVNDALSQTPEFTNIIDALKKYKDLFDEENKFKEVRELEDAISYKLKRIIEAKSNIKLDTTNFDQKIIPTPRLLTNDNREIDINPVFQGNGLQRALIFSLLELLSEHKSPKDKKIGPLNLIMIEEPEIYMHPQMERKVADTLYDIAKNGSAQIICTTHSPSFIRFTEYNNSLVKLIRSENSQTCEYCLPTLFIGQTKADAKKRLRLLLNFDPTVNEIFFAKRVVLVEGDTEIAVLRKVAELLNLFSDEKNKSKSRDTTFINCRGKWTITFFQEVLNAFNIDYVVIHDKDEEQNEDGANKKIMELLGNDSKRMMFDKKIETLLSLSEKNTKDKPFIALQKIEDLFDSSKLESHPIVNYVKFAFNIVS